MLRTADQERPDVSAVTQKLCNDEIIPGFLTAPLRRGQCHWIPPFVRRAGRNIPNQLSDRWREDGSHRQRAVAAKWGLSAAKNKIVVNAQPDLDRDPIRGNSSKMSEVQL